MEYGIVFPHHEIGTDPAGIREFARGTEDLGFTHLLIYDHVLGADPNRPGGWSGPYDKDVAFHEPFVTFAFLAAVTTRIELVTAVLVLPQRQTALVAKQAADVDLLSGGRLRLGIGTGWNEVEYEALGVSFRDRGRRQEEQVEVLRALWGGSGLKPTAVVLNKCYELLHTVAHDSVCEKGGEAGGPEAGQRSRRASSVQGLGSRGSRGAEIDRPDGSPTAGERAPSALRRRDRRR